VGRRRSATAIRLLTGTGGGGTRWEAVRTLSSALRESRGQRLGRAPADDDEAPRRTAAVLPVLLVSAEADKTICNPPFRHLRDAQHLGQLSDAFASADHSRPI
jgi:hypothetical protein